jgi:hypothetical protein
MKKTIVSTSLLLSTLLLALTVFIGSCSKDEEPPTTHAVQGLWTGTQTNASAQTSAFTMSIKADGTATYENILLGTQQFCAGTWTLNGTAFTCNTTCIYGLASNVGVKQTFTAVFNPTTGTLSSGQWVNTFPLSSATSGTFSLTKVN